MRNKKHSHLFQRNNVTKVSKEWPCQSYSYLRGEPMAQILAIGTTRAEQIPLRFSLRTIYRDMPEW